MEGLRDVAGLLHASGLIACARCRWRRSRSYFVAAPGLHGLDLHPLQCLSREFLGRPLVSTVKYLDAMREAQVGERLVQTRELAKIEITNADCSKEDERRISARPLRRGKTETGSAGSHSCDLSGQTLRHAHGHALHRRIRWCRPASRPARSAHEYRSTSRGWKQDSAPRGRCESYSIRLRCTRTSPPPPGKSPRPADRVREGRRHRVWAICAQECSSTGDTGHSSGLRRWRRLPGRRSVRETLRKALGEKEPGSHPRLGC